MPTASALRLVIRSPNRKCEKTATHTGAVYSSTTAVAPPLSLMAICMAPKNTPTPHAPNSTKIREWRSGMRSPPVSPACARKKAQPMPARQKAISSGSTPVCWQNLETTPSSDHNKVASKIHMYPSTEFWRMIFCEATGCYAMPSAAHTRSAICVWSWGRGVLFQASPASHRGTRLQASLASLWQPSAFMPWSLVTSTA